MFTGIVEEVGRIAAISWGERSARLTVEAPRVSQGTRIGDSIAVSGTCLTVVEMAGAALSFDAVPETVERASLKAARIGAGVNLERALAVGDRLGGHFVQGHVDGAGTVASIGREDTARVFRIDVPAALARYVIPKGSVAVDGVSLTAVEVGTDYFTVWIIPHTFENTTFGERHVGDQVNIENDMLGRYVEKLMRDA